jgi:hypothetical protein
MLFTSGEPTLISELLKMMKVRLNPEATDPTRVILMLTEAEISL